MNRRFPWISALAVVLLVAVAVAAPWLGLPNPIRMAMTQRMASPSAAAWLGRDEYGRDVLSRIIWGARSSLTVAFAAAALAAIVGTALGVIGGFIRGVAEILTLRAADVLLCFPPLLLALLVVTILGPGVDTLIPVLALVFIPGFIRVSYAGVLSVRSQDYVEAMRVLGVGRWRIMARTILPNIGGPLLVQFSLVAATAVVLESGLSFLGLGVVPPAPSWGLMIGAARTTMNQQPLLLLWPSLALTVTILSLNGLCDGLRDYFDPHPQGALDSRAFHATRTAPSDVDPPVLAIDGLTLSITSGPKPVEAVRDVSFALRPRETLAIVGESGSGKSLTGLAVMGLLAPAVSVTGGSVRLHGRELLALDDAAMAKVRGGTAAMIFQDSMSNLNPVHRVGDQIAEAVRSHNAFGAAEASRKAVDLLRSVGIPDPEARARAYPHELSGGMRQRVMIAMAIANDPVLLIADEPTTALDVTIQAQVLDLLAKLKDARHLAMIFVSHSLPVVSEIADRVAVMYAGEIVEEGTTAEVFGRPLHPYTAALLTSAPSEDGPPPQPIGGSVPSPGKLPPGCAFAPRCGHRTEACEAARPPLAAVAHGRASRCIRWSELP